MTPDGAPSLAHLQLRQHPLGVRRAAAAADRGGRAAEERIGELCEVVEGGGARPVQQPGRGRRRLAAAEGAARAGAAEALLGAVGGEHITLCGR